jgi:hypothetical protein
MGRSMTEETPPWDEYVETSAKVLGLPMDPAWKDSVRANIEVIFRLARLVESFELPDDEEPAPVFEA